MILFCHETEGWFLSERLSQTLTGNQDLVAYSDRCRDTQSSISNTSFIGPGTKRKRALVCISVLPLDLHGEYKQYIMTISTVLDSK